MTTFSASDDKRTQNNGARHQYRALSDEEKRLMVRIKDLALELESEILKTPGRESSIAITNLQTATMWAVRAVTS